MEKLSETLRWIHHDLTQAVLAPLLQDVLGRLTRQPAALYPALFPAVCRDKGKLVAAAYFKMLEGNVATLGGVRALKGWADQATALIDNQVDCLRGQGVPQIQAVVSMQDGNTSELVARAGFNRLTNVQHQWLDLSLPEYVAIGVEAVPAVTSLLWRPVGDFARSRVARLIEGTFQETLDCPKLNGLRDRSEVLDGFLDGHSLRTVGQLWEILEFRGELAGCLVLQPHDHGVLELAYLGLLPQARGKRLGKQLIRRAIQQAVKRHAQALVAAVDEQNWPALELYRQFDFKPQQRFEVWLSPT